MLEVITENMDEILEGLKTIALVCLGAGLPPLLVRVAQVLVSKFINRGVGG